MVRPNVIDLFHSNYPGYQGEERVFRIHLERALPNVRVVLEVGCGSGALCNHDLREPGRIVIGVDPDSAVRSNPWIDHAVVGSATNLPIPGESIDLVVMRYVLEHLDDPGAVFAEVARVLRPGGRWVLITPNRLHYVAAVARFTPTWFHRLIKRGHAVEPDDVYPTFYRANRPGIVTRYAQDAGLQVRSLQLFEGSPNYLEFSRWLYRCGVGYERMVNRFRVLEDLRSCFIATIAKPGHGGGADNHE